MNQEGNDNQVRNDETSAERLREMLLRVIAEDNYVPNDCKVPEHDESEIASTLTGSNREYYEEANNNEDDSCQYYIANSFLKGKTQFPVDKAIAFKYMKKAASHGNKYAIYGLSYLMKPNALSNNFEGAENYIKMLRISAYFNSGYASYILGFLYSNGFHVEKNYVISLVYLKFSADKKYPPAMLMFADRLKKIIKKRISRSAINRQKINCIDFLNDETGINKINGKLRATSALIFNVIEDRKLAYTTSLVYYMKVIEDDKSTEEEKNIAQEKLTTLVNKK